MNKSLCILGLVSTFMFLRPAGARPGGGVVAPTVGVARSWLAAVLKKDATKLASLSGLPFENHAFQDGNRHCPRGAKDQGELLKLATCMFKDERYNQDLLAQGSTWKIVPFKAVQQRVSDLPPAATPPDLKALASAKDLIFVEGRAKQFRGVVGIYLAIRHTAQGDVVVAAVDFGDIQVDSGE